MRAKRPPIFVFSGPSGCGKTTLCRLIEERLDAYYSVSYTTRLRRSGEVSGRDYVFVSPHEFQSMIDEGGFLEWEEVHDNLYGTPKAPILERQKAGQIVILDVDVKGALSVRRRFKETVLIFIMPPSWEELESRLLLRGKDSREVIKKRLINARKESEFRDQYDHIVVNDSLDRLYGEVEGIIHHHVKQND